MPSTRDAARLTGAAALLVAAAYIAAVPIADVGSAPDADASPATVAANIADHRTGILVALVLNGFAWCALMPAALASLREMLGAQVRIPATLGLVGAAVEAALIGVALLLEGAAALGAPRLSAGEVAALHDGYLFALAASAWPTVLCALGFAAAIARSAVLPRWTAGLAVVVAAAHTGAGLSVADHGALSATGPFAVAAPVLMTVWLAAIGVAVLRLAGRPAAARREVAVA